MPWNYVFHILTSMWLHFPFLANHLSVVWFLFFYVQFSQFLRLGCSNSWPRFSTACRRNSLDWLAAFGWMPTVAIRFDGRASRNFGVGNFTGSMKMAIAATTFSSRLGSTSSLSVSVTFLAAALSISQSRWKWLSTTPRSSGFSSKDGWPLTV